MTRNENAAAQTIILAAYCDWSYAKERFETIEEARKLDSVYRLPARVTKKSYIVRYGGDAKHMESGNGNVRKILPRFRRDGDAIINWRHLIGSHERCSRALIRFQLEASEGK